ncbi:uncharacterized protein BcabD6B2_36180 [Babesia caballi]|uniref:Uncharacterized protein n=1 Tax=Babesia caballi TaxID=5871 RepID=A0AAV4LVI8_BABCB|nr:hypothetical protein, conserved [Babesia caballi]
MEENSLCRRKNVKVLVVVDQWLLRDLSHLVRTKLPALIHNNAPPMVDQMHSLDNRSRKGWSRFLLQFVILPLFTFGGFVCYQLYALVSLPIRDLASYALGGPASRWSRRKEADDGRQQALDADESRD